MGVIIPQVVTSGRATGAQVIDGSLKFDDSANQHLKRTISASNRRTFTLSAWVKHSSTDSNDRLLGNYTDSTNYSSFYFRDTPDFQISFVERVSDTYNINAHSRRMARDTGWYHIVWAVDTTQATDTDRVKLYVNGVQETLNESYSSGTLNTNAPTLPSQNYETRILGAYDLKVGARSGTDCWDGLMSQFYVIDGQALGPENFGFTDPLTNTWRPKKYEGTFGTNGFWLPMDGNSPIGQDQSGQGNDFTPVNFGGSVELDNPQVSGARPILNTTPGGTQAGVGVFGSKQNVGYAVTVYDDGGGNKYYIDGVKTASITGLIRGATYTFDTSDSTVSTHPFRLSATSNGSHGGGSEYTNGVAAITGAATTITVPYDAPETLYYYCTVHSGMGNDSSISGITTNEKLADQYASHCVLAVPFINGLSDDVSASIACTSTTKSLTKQGDPTSSSTSSNFYSSSTDFDGTGDYYTSGSESDFAFGTGDFTVEFWFDSDDLGGSNQEGFLQISDTSGGLKTGYANGFAIYESATAGGVLLSGLTGTIPAVFKPGVWNHVALVREGTSVRLYANGVLKDTQTSSKNISGTYLALGGYYSTTYVYNGRMQDFRIYKGVAKYNGNFVVPVTSPAILPDTPSGVSGSSKLTKITDGAVSFDGTNDILSVPDHADFTFGSGDFTMEAFVYNKSSSYRSIVMKYGGSPATSSWFWSMYNGQNQFYYYSGSNEPAVTSGQTHYNRWVHCAVSREGNTIRIFDNGELTGTLDVSSYATMNDSTVPLDIGADYANNYDMDGFISNVRIVKGTALYTKNFTPPSVPLTNVTNTKLLCCQSNASAGAAAVSPQISGLNSGTVWSDYLTTTQGANSRDFYTVASYPASNLFDGDTSTIVYGGWIDDSDDASDLIFSPPSGISVSSKLEVYVGYYDKIKVNGTTYNTGGQSTAQAWVTVSDGSNFTGTLTELILENTTNANVVRAAAIRIDDSTILLDPVLQQGNAVATNFNPFNTNINTVRGQETGYATLNPLRYSGYTTSDRIFTDGNLRMLGRGDGVSNFGVTTGKFYAEVFVERIKSGESGQGYIGVIAEPETYAERGWPTSKIAALRDSGGGGSNNFYGDGKGTTTTTWTEGDTISVAFDADAAKVWIAKNGQYINGGNPATGATASFSGLTFKDYYFLVSDNKPSSNPTTDGNRYQINFGQKPFKYAPPDDFQPLNTANTRPTTVISRPDQFVGITTWRGNDTQRDIRTFNMKPDLAWIKQRTGSANHSLMDTVRGATKNLVPNDTQSQGTETGYLNAFIDNGFSLGTSSIVNDASNDYVAWCWKAGGSKNTFNVDGVGHASASDVNMNVGGQNSNAYNTSAIWSGMMSGTSNSGVYTSLFNGTDGDAAGYEQPSDGNTLTFTPTGGITASSSIEIYVYQSSSTYSGSADITVNGTSIKTGAVQSALGTGAAGGYVNTGTKSLTTLTWSNPSGSNNDYRLMAIRVDGKILVDSNQTPPNLPSIAPSGCSVGTKQGFSIIKYEGNGTSGATLPHGLTQVPDFAMVKNLEESESWGIYHSSQGGRNYAFLNANNAFSASSALWNNTSPGAAGITLGNYNGTNKDDIDFIAYLWHDVPGLQKFGTYVGNENTGGNGPFVELGFRPAIIWIKNTDQGSSAADWVIYDSERNKFNPSGKQLYPNRNIAEADDSNHQFDILSNGFKVRSTSTSDLTNATDTYIYCAWAEVPSIDLYGGGANAR